MLFLFVFLPLWTHTSFVMASNPTRYPTSQPSGTPSSQPVSSPSKLPTPSPTASPPPIISTLVNQRGLAGSDGMYRAPLSLYPLSLSYNHTHIIHFISHLPSLLLIHFDLSGDGGPALLATLDRPSDVITDPMGNMYIADTYNNKIRKVSVDTGRLISTVAGMYDEEEEEEEEEEKG